MLAAHPEDPGVNLSSFRYFHVLASHSPFKMGTVLLIFIDWSSLTFSYSHNRGTDFLNIWLSEIADVNYHV